MDTTTLILLILQAIFVFNLGRMYGIHECKKIVDKYK
jgi:hypothetical protein